MPLTLVELGVRLKEHRESLAISVSDAASSIEISDERLAALETGEASITSLEIHRLSKLYRTTLGVLLLRS
jgi:plasmid maintenance system antidote protein VapI